MYFTKQLKKKKKFVMKNSGFTLMEALVSIFIMSSIIFLLLNFLLLIKENINYDKNISSYTTSIIHIKEDFLESKKYKIKKGNLFLYKYNKEDVSYIFDNNRLIRKVNDKGYEIILNNVKKLKFEKENDIVYLNVLFFKDKENKKEVIYDFK